MNKPTSFAALLAQDADTTAVSDTRRSEILLFSVGTEEVFGINVFRVREVTRTPVITKSPNARSGIEGFISLRGALIPVIDPARVMSLHSANTSKSQLIVTEIAGKTRGFVVDCVNEIVRINWSEIRPAESVVADEDSRMINAITRLPDGRLVSIIDVESIIFKAIGITESTDDVQRLSQTPTQSVFFVDDSSIARKKIASTLERMGVNFAVNMSGNQAWNVLQDMAVRCRQEGSNVRDKIFLIVLDAEMADLDGYALCEMIKADRAFSGIPVLIHSSLSSEPNRKLANEVGADAIIAPFTVQAISETIAPFAAR